MNFIAHGKPILLEAGTPSYDNPRIHVLYSTGVGHNVLDVVGCAAKKAPAPIIVHRLDAGGGEVTVDGTAGYPVLKQWQRKVSWSADRLDVVDEVLFPEGKPVRLAQPCSAWTLKTGLMERR